MKLGLISGIGSAAGIHFADMLVKEAQSRGAKEDCDFPTYVLLNVPFKGTSEIGIVNPGLVTEQMRHALRQLNALDCTIGIMCCNSVHQFHDEFQQCFAGTLLNMVEIACHKVSDKKVVGVLCSDSSRQTGLYTKALSKLNIRPVQTTDRQQALLNSCIEAVMAGKQEKMHFEFATDICKSMMKLGSEALLIACTELPYVISPDCVDIPVIDAGEETIKVALDLLHG